MVTVARDWKRSVSSIAVKSSLLLLPVFLFQQSNMGDGNVLKVSIAGSSSQVGPQLHEPSFVLKTPPRVHEIRVILPDHGVRQCVVKTYEDKEPYVFWSSIDQQLVVIESFASSWIVSFQDLIGHVNAEYSLDLEFFHQRFHPHSVIHRVGSALAMTLRGDREWGHFALWMILPPSRTTVLLHPFDGLLDYDRNLNRERSKDFQSRTRYIDLSPVFTISGPNSGEYTNQVLLSNAPPLTQLTSFDRKRKIVAFGENDAVPRVRVLRWSGSKRPRTADLTAPIREAIGMRVPELTRWKTLNLALTRKHLMVGARTWSPIGVRSIVVRTPIEGSKDGVTRSDEGVLAMPIEVFPQQDLETLMKSGISDGN